MGKLKVTGIVCGIIFSVLSSIGLLLAGLSWVIGMHIIPVNTNIESLRTEIKTEIKKLKDNDLKHLKYDIDKIKKALKIK